MTRIIAGTLGGRRIAVPPHGTRPTSDRVREALFSRLSHSGVLTGARVLDLYAGSGGLGLEALSRGGAHATFVEANGAAARVLQANIRELGLGADTAIIREKVLPFLRRGGPPQAVDVVFADPPYDISPGDVTAMLAALEPALAPGATIVMEWSTRAPAPTWPDGVSSVSSKKYGETMLHFAQSVAVADAATDATTHQPE